MKSHQFITKIRNYSLIAFLLPLITIILCLFLFKLLGDTDVYPNFSWNEKRFESTPKVHSSIGTGSRSFINCPINKYSVYISTTDDHTLLWIKEDISFYVNNLELITNLFESNEIKSLIIIQGKTKNNRCIKNNKFVYLLLNNSKTLGKFFIKVKK